MLKRILVVEDEFDWYDPLMKALQGRSRNVQLFDTDSAAVDALRSSSAFDVAIVNVNLKSGEGSGYSVLNELRDLQINTSTILLTGGTDQNPMELGKTYALKECYQKGSTSVSHIVSFVERLLNQNRIPMSSSELQQHSYVLFIRILGIKTMKADEVLGAVQLLTKLLSSRSDLHYNPHGAFVLCDDGPSLLLALAEDVVVKAYRQGVQVTGGIARGMVSTVLDLPVMPKGPPVNRIGPTINNAARLAFSQNKASIAIDHRIAEHIATISSDYKSRLSKKTTKRVKRQSPQYRGWKIELPPLGSMPPRPEVPSSSDIDLILAYDIEDFTSRSASQQKNLVGALIDAVVTSLSAVNKHVFRTASYLPGGDGGFLVFSASQLPSAITFAKVLAKQCEGSEVPIRLGLAQGFVVVDQNLPPIGPGIYAAEKQCAHSKPYKLCAESDLFKEIKHDFDDGFWITASTSTPQG